ncbi:MAG: hypothetical protein NVS3B25_19840 [Hymenobacter sp.]
MWLLPAHGALCTGPPEDLVLSGTFAAAFEREGLAFDPATGTFALHAPGGPAVQVVGEGAVAFCEQMFLDCPARVRAGFGRQFANLDLYDDVPKLTVPTGLLVGELDRLEPPWHARRMAKELPHVVELVELPGVGHMTPIEAPHEVTPRLRHLATEHLGNRALAATGG